MVQVITISSYSILRLQDVTHTTLVDMSLIFIRSTSYTLTHALAHVHTFGRLFKEDTRRDTRGYNSQAVMEFTSRRNRRSRPQVTIPVSRLRPDTTRFEIGYLRNFFVYDCMICAIRTATRRLSFQTPSFYARHPSTSQEVFVPESPERPTSGHYWGPGESLPVTDFQPVATSSPVQTQTEQPDLYSLIQGM